MVRETTFWRFKAALRECCQQKVTTQEVFVVTGLSKPLLGLPAIEALHLIQRIEEVREAQEDFKAAYPTVFSGLGLLKENYTIVLERDVTLHHEEFQSLYEAKSMRSSTSWKRWESSQKSHRLQTGVREWSSS